MYFGLFDPTMYLLIPAIILALWAQTKVSSTFNKYSKDSKCTRFDRFRRGENDIRQKWFVFG